MAFTKEQGEAILRISRVESSVIETTMTAAERAAQVASVAVAREMMQGVFGLCNTLESTKQELHDSASQLTAAITAATDQAKASSAESANLAAQSKELSEKLNSLTKWIVFAALVSAGSAAAQAWLAVFHPSNPEVLIMPSPVR